MSLHVIDHQALFVAVEPSNRVDPSFTTFHLMVFGRVGYEAVWTVVEQSSRSTLLHHRISNPQSAFVPASAREGAAAQTPVLLGALTRGR
jgi:hypothetical protein